MRPADCTAPLTCLLGRCRTECTAQRDCPIGTRCVIGASGGGSCALGDDPRCPETACEGSLLCVDSACVNACDAVSSCPEGSICTLDSERRGYCERADADAGPPTGCTPPDCDPAIDIELTTLASCARTRSGAVWCWGYGDHLGRPPTDLGTCGASGSFCSTAPVRARYEHDGITLGRSALEEPAERCQVLE